MNIQNLGSDRGGTLAPVRRRHWRRHLSSQMNRAFAPALVKAIDQMNPEHPNYAYWQERRELLVILCEVAS